MRRGGLIAALLAAAGIVAVVSATGSAGSRDDVAAPPVTTATAISSPPIFVVGPREVRPEIKSAATRFVERVGTYEAPESAEPTARLAAEGYPTDLVEEARPILDQAAASATSEVVYPQYGGLTEATASVLVLVRQRLTRADTEFTREVLVDLRLRADPSGWQVTSVIDPARPAVPPERPGGPTAVGAALLADPRIRVPEPTRADITERRLDDLIMRVVQQLAGLYELEIQAAVTGHPRTVFPTTRLSNHAVGRAVDVRAIDGVRVVDLPRDGPVLREFMAEAGRAGATEVGGPITVAGTGFFTDDVHQDHIHLGITPTKPPAAAR
ncbi:hypothetical protein [Pseudonocardia sp. WMMC193]|uniref:hypothetical protein n=1 Tax=Pseudonocardia sp. WMMC193 TaxID=2911965 RepID=UPI001F21BBDE|nr:hypothetical protein [Pseudonocardia sp. WMMC193]MCF7552715.1 hypothetical protein [Pseudonocardia sp. WMMC193]